ncbi:SDR family NAD(P)-dependent oxidoreductase [Actinopolymorpha pittospori]|uniref:NAD(P)-dependent dehydrogenase (Short-subunit alcohol dehydrogenase family) n=1 Tax=Actinopolymorpha pittospori TaxID=648752 RepID=A0A927MNX4_9ACTN|nr:SDR family oxidoreductase [Actinopolymorpha pittospori]MBE1603457.1 NAD(P)-dependent dehydrogenase (short-subunit alcohol dehydrogenase family) [Actinopolymorpha pittospori]
MSEPRQNSEGNLSDPVALVTGGSRGLGLLLARELADRGMRLVICARSSDDLARACDDLRERGTDLLTLPCDVSDSAAAQQMIEKAVAHFGRLDVVVNNAGIIQVGPLAAMTVEDFHTALAAMCLGPIHVTLAALPHLRQQGFGHIINVTSIGGKIAAPHILPYACAKFGVVGFSEGLRAELAGTGITVTTVVPGLMRTGSHLRATFRGDPAREYAWFAAGASLPLVSIHAERAARRIITAGIAGKPELTLTPLAVTAARMAGLAPGPTTRLLGLVNRLLPKPPPDPRSRTGREARQELHSRLHDVLTTWGRRAAQQYNQVTGRDQIPRPRGG